MPTGKRRDRDKEALPRKSGNKKEFSLKIWFNHLIGNISHKDIKIFFPVKRGSPEKLACGHQDRQEYSVIIHHSGTIYFGTLIATQAAYHLRYLCSRIPFRFIMRIIISSKPIKFSYLYIFLLLVNICIGYFHRQILKEFS